MWQFFTERGKKVIQLAHHEALRMGHPMVEPEHILLGLIHEGGGTACQAMIALGLDLERIKSQIEEAMGQSQPFAQLARKRRYPGIWRAVRSALGGRGSGTG